MNQNLRMIEHDGLRRFLRQVEGLSLDINVLCRDYNKLGSLEAQQYRILSLLCRINKVSVSFVVSCLIKKECAVGDYQEGLICLRLEEVIELLVSGSLPSVFTIRKDFERGSVAFHYPWHYSVTRVPGSRLQYPFRNYVPGLKERIAALPWVALGFKASAANNPEDPGSHSYTIECVRQA
nr:hypothetical protein [Grapevine virus B]